MTWRFLFGLIFFALLEASGQNYRFKQYRVQDGLPIDIIKSVTQDSLGFFWIATDDGVVKFDGVNFTVYKSAFRSQFVKGFLHTSTGKLLAFGDLDLVEIQNKIDTVIFKTILHGGRNQTDTTLLFPKSIYLDYSKEIWIAEPQSVVRYDGEKIKRYDFGAENSSPIFIRSFNFFEDDNHTLYTTSYQGRVFRYDRASDSFKILKTKLPEDVNHVLFTKEKLLVASNSGLFLVTIKDHEIQNIVKTLVPIKDASYLINLNDSTFMVGSYLNQIVEVNAKDFSSKILSYSFDGINAIYKSNEGDLWVSADKGIVLVQKNIFEVADPFSRTHFVENIAQNKNNNDIYYCNKENLVRLHFTQSSGWKSDVLYSLKSGYFQSLQFGKEGLWASNSFSVLLFKNDKLFKQWNLSKDGNFVYDIFLDKKENLWLSQSGSSNVVVIYHDFSKRKYHLPLKAQSEINLVREGSKGIYVAASGADGYLFFKPNNDSIFQNISLPVNFKLQGDFNISNMIVDADVIWLASTEGLLKYDHHSIQRIDLGEGLTTFSVSTVAKLDDRNILFSNSYGLFRYDIKTGEHWSYDENAGLPSNTITDHGIFVDNKGRPWIGTSDGLAFTTESLLQKKTTLKPFCVSATVNGISKRFAKGITADYGSFISLDFSTITFPESKIKMQWQIKEKDTAWHELRNHKLNLSDLKSGNYTICVRAKKNTGLGWSEPSIVKIFLEKPFWEQPLFILSIILFILIIVWASYVVSSKIMNKRREYLQDLIDKRTRDLQSTNEELSLRNEELDRFVYSASHDLSAPLKSLLGLITISRLENPGDTHNTYLTMMESSVRRLDLFIQEVVSYSRNARMNVHFEKFDFKKTVEGLLQDYQYSKNFSQIDFIIEDNTSQLMISDSIRLKIILNNLISNAIKFKRQEENLKSFVRIALSKENNQYTIVAEDNGKGISENHLKGIFEMFYRASDDSQGSGLGLYILKETVNKLNGSVTVKSAYGSGTTFIISLPIPNS